MLDVAVLQGRVERVEVQEGRDVRVGRWAVVAFVEVFGRELPVVATRERVDVVQGVVGEGDVCVAFLHVDVCEELGERDLGGGGRVEIYPDEAVAVDVCVDREDVGCAGGELGELDGA